MALDKIRNDKPPAHDPIFKSSNYPVSPSDRQTTAELNQENGISKDQILKYRDLNDLSQKDHSSDRQYGNDTVQEQGTCLDSPSESSHLIL